MKLYFIKVGYFLIFIFAILNFLGLKQTEFEIRQLDSTARILTTHAEAIQAAQEQPTLNAAAAAALTRADTQIAIASFSNENVAGEAKRLASLCNANIKEKSITASVSNDAVLEEMARRPNMYGRLVIPSVGVNVALFAVVSQAAADAQDSAAYFPFKNYMLVADHWNQGFWKIKRCSVERKLIFIAELRYKRLHVPASVAARTLVMICCMRMGRALRQAAEPSCIPATVRIVTISH